MQARLLEPGVAIFGRYRLNWENFKENMAYDGYGKRQRMDGNSYGMAPPSKRVREGIFAAIR